MTTRSKTVRTLGFAFALITSIVSMSSASYAYTEEQAQMCTGDAFKFCSSEIPNISAVTACMYKHKAELSAGCRAVMDKPAADKVANK